MREAAFIKQNKARWEEFEKTVKSHEEAQPDRLADLFIQVTDDLSYARTKYPDSRTTQYLNALASKLHLGIYKNKKEDRNRFAHFWKYEVPQVSFELRKPMLYALIIFVIAGIMGAVSALYDDTFVRLILSDGYVNMTLENIKKGNPTDVYDSMPEGIMFVYITLNNIMVSFRVFVFGVIASVGAGFELFRNALMVGTFMAFFYKESQLSQALPVIMLHGTIELSSIVIAAAAGFSLGNGLIFPGTYSRLEAFKRGAKKGMKLVVGLVPFFVIAGFIESFVTRHAFMHWSFKVLIIGLSAALMIYYFVIYPHQLHKNGKLHVD